jgi:hypothetical protein
MVSMRFVKLVGQYCLHASSGVKVFLCGMRD